MAKYKLKGARADAFPNILLDLVGYYDGTKNREGIIPKYARSNPEDLMTIRGLELRFELVKRIKTEGIEFNIYTADEKHIFLQALGDCNLCYQNAIAMALVVFSKDKETIREMQKRKALLGEIIVYIKNN